MAEVMRRTLRRSKLAGRFDAADLLRMLLLAEVVDPSPHLWLVTPWVSDVPILDNRTLQFASLDPRWGPRDVRLSEILVRRAELGARTTVVTRAGETHNTAFLDALGRLARSRGVDEDLLRTTEDDLLHEKGLASARFSLSGSMNVTWNGIHISSERVDVTTDPVEVQGALQSFSERYGGTDHP